MTWNDLLNQLQEMSKEQLQEAVTVQTGIRDEFEPMGTLVFTKAGDDADGILDHGDAYLSPYVPAKEPSS